MSSWLNITNDFFSSKKRKKVKSLGKCSLQNLRKPRQSSTPGRVNGTQIPSFQNCSSHYSKFYVLVNEIIGGSPGTDHIRFATFGTTRTPIWKYLANELGPQEWVLSSRDRKLAVLKFTEVRKYLGIGNSDAFPWGCGSEHHISISVMGFFFFLCLICRV